MSLLERIEKARKERETKVHIEAIVRAAVKDAKVAVAIHRSTDGGLLVHTAVERG